MNTDDFFLIKIKIKIDFMLYADDGNLIVELGTDRD